MAIAYPDVSRKAARRAVFLATRQTRLGNENRGRGERIVADTVSISAALAALFEHVPPPRGEIRWTGKLLCARTAATGRAVSESQLSQIRQQRIESPSWDMVVAIADAFGVNVAFFTVGYHMRYHGMNMRNRVLLARNDYQHLLAAAAAIEELVPAHRHVVDTLVDILLRHETGRGSQHVARRPVGEDDALLRHRTS